MGSTDLKPALPRVMNLDADVLQAAQRLSHTVQVPFSGALLAQGLAQTVTQWRQPLEQFAHTGTHGFGLFESTFQRGFGGVGGRG